MKRRFYQTPTYLLIQSLVLIIGSFALATCRVVPMDVFYITLFVAIGLQVTLYKSL